eukprot:Seg1614.13 transcript_id=Seg1614.13/GoldUCD/mRNA.D3Y31 product="Retrovirus-related Pol polyprotein from transposon 17.6" protein_id=Seg1614.13/GoldUCD/D3Y31
MDSLAGQSYFSSFDLTSGYWQVEKDTDSCDKTVFSVPVGHFSWNVMPFGLCNAVTTFQRLMTRVLAGQIGNQVFAYLDDVLTAGTDFQDHLALLRCVFYAFRKANLKLNLKKCEFVQDSVEYLGFVVDGNGVKPNPKKVEAVVSYEQPVNVEELHRFMGLLSYYQRFMSGVSNIMSSLNKHLQKGVKCNWSENCDKAFKELKGELNTNFLFHSSVAATISI